MAYQKRAREANHLDEDFKQRAGGRSVFQSGVRSVVGNLPVLIFSISFSASKMTHSRVISVILLNSSPYHDRTTTLNLGFSRPI